MTMEERIAEAKRNNWDWETYESADDYIVLQVWPNAMVMMEYVYTQEGDFVEESEHHAW